MIEFIDIFCGSGGSSTRLVAAVELGREHWPGAIQDARGGDCRSSVCRRQ